ncbi:MAG TPA: OmpA family protein [Gammaproteobacteria bacterium]|nr:OmpA family protein [Gammaproteobacteria bacterium]
MKPTLSASIALLGLVSLGTAVPTLSAETSQPIASSDVLSRISMFSYMEGAKSKLVLRGTPIAPNAEGKAEVEYKDGNARIKVSVERLPNPPSLGPYTTYVLWALTPDGRAYNEGVLAEFSESNDKGKGELETTYNASQFALIVTAEPHFAVSLPSGMIALYNVADDVKGTETKITTVTERADYSYLSPIPADEKTAPLWLVEARYAVDIAEHAGAQRYAPNDYATATERLSAAEGAIAGEKGGKKKERENAHKLTHEAVIASEDARRAAIVASARASSEEERLATANAAAEAERQRSAAAAEEDLRRRLDAALPTRQTDRGLVAEIAGVEFGVGKADLSPAAREALARFAGVVASYPALRFSVEGHTDSTGSPTANNQLSLLRAMAVRDYLVSQGVAAEKITVNGFGPARPVADNGTAEGRARNRRVEIVIPHETMTPALAPSSKG